MSKSAHLVTGAAAAKLAKDVNASFGPEKAQMVVSGSVYMLNFLGAIALPATTLASQPFIVDAADRLEKERSQSPTQVLLVVYNDSLEIWSDGPEFQELAKIGLLQVVHTGAVEGRFTKDFCIVHRHRTAALMTFFFRVKDAVMNVPADVGKLFSGAAKAAKAQMKSPFKKLPGSEGGADSAAAGKEVLEDTPWFVGKTPREEVESAMKVGLAGDYVIRESGSTAGAYVFVLKTSPTAFIERKIRKDAKGRYLMDGDAKSHATLGQLIQGDARATRPAKGVVLGELFEVPGGVARRAAVSGARANGMLDLQTDVKSYNAIYCGYQQVFGQADVKGIIKRCVIKNSHSRETLKRTKSSKGEGAYLQLKNSEQFGTVVEELPVTIVITPQMVRVVDRMTGESLKKVFIQNVQHTLESPTREGHMDKFAFIHKNQQDTVVCHIFNIIPGQGRVLGEAIAYFREQAADLYSKETIAKVNPFAATGEREKAPPKLFAKQIHRADIAAVKAIGAGHFGEVWLATQAVRGVPAPVMRAVKTLKSGGGRQEFIREAECMIGFDHANVNQIVGLAVQQPPWLYVFEYMEHGDVREFIRSAYHKGATLEVGELLRICMQIAAGCEYLASLRLVHMDIAARNCLLGANNVVKVSDFGMTEALSPGKSFHKADPSAVFAARWAPPEVHESKCFSEKTDVWSFGITCWEIFHNADVPFKTTRSASLLRELKKGLQCPQPPLKMCPAPLWAVLKQCWALKHPERCTFTQARIAMAKVSGNLPAYKERDVGAFVKAAVAVAQSDRSGERRHGGLDSGIASAGGSAAPDYTTTYGHDQQAELRTYYAGALSASYKRLVKYGGGGEDFFRHLGDVGYYGSSAYKRALYTAGGVDEKERNVDLEHAELTPEQMAKALDEAVEAMSTHQTQYEDLFKAYTAQAWIAELEDVHAGVMANIAGLNIPQPIVQPNIWEAEGVALDSKRYLTRLIDLYDGKIAGKQPVKHVAEECADIVASQFAGGMTFSLGPTKNDDRAIEKSKKHPKGYFNEIRDYARGMFIVKEEAAIPPLVQALNSASAFALIRAKNRFSRLYDSDSSAGYRDYQIVVRARGGWLVELQIIPEAMYTLKSSLGHADYTEFRFIIEARNRNMAAVTDSSAVAAATDGSSSDDSELSL